MPHGLINGLIYSGLLLVGGLAGFFIGRFLYEKMVSERTNAIKMEAQNIIEEAKAEEHG
jgi:Leu/Phe-tRNA-protein transferase